MECLEQLTVHLGQPADLSGTHVADAVAALVDAEVAVPVKAQFLSALAIKGETPEEIGAFARELRARCVAPRISGELQGRPLLDIVGTGGDRLSTFNISTTVALIACAAGVPVTKHGNRASTSPVGSADVMEALGLEFELGPEDIDRALEQQGFAYFYAPKYHPAFKHIVPARKLCAQQGRTTIFNFLGPLLNPARPAAMLIGVPRPSLCEPLAKVLQSLGVRRAMVVSGSVVDEAGQTRYLDELSPLGPTTIAEFYQEKALTCSEFSPATFPVQPATLADLHGGDREYNAEVIRRILSGKERGPKRDAVLLNAAAALFVADHVPNMASGWDRAAELIDSGVAWQKFQDLAKRK